MQIKFVRGLAAISLAISAIGAQAAGYGSNLIVNGDAENGVVGWTTVGNAIFESTAYSSNWVQPTEPGPVDRGMNLFVGGGGVAVAAGSQWLDLSANAADISSGGDYQLNGGSAAGPISQTMP